MTVIFEPERWHSCVLELTNALGSKTPAPGSIARCTCGRYLVLDDRSGRWRPIRRRSRLVREALAHYDERHPGGTR